jgi:hypothetical protein
MNLNFLITLFTLLVGPLMAVHPQWSTPPLVVGPGDTPDLAQGGFGAAQVGVDASGNSYAVWVNDDFTTGFPSVFASILPFGATSWSNPVELWPSPTETIVATFPQISVTPSGKAIVVWNVGPDLVGPTGANYVYYSFYDGNIWSSALPVDLLSPSDFDTFPQVAINPSGDAVAVWNVNNSTNRTDTVYSATFNGNVWIPKGAISGPSQAFASGPFFTNVLTFPQVGIDNAGNALAIWQRQLSSTTTVGQTVVESAYYTSSSGTWSLPSNPPLARGDIDFPFPEFPYGMVPQICMNANGAAVAIWDLYTESSLTYSTKSKSFKKGAWSKTTDLGFNTSVKNTFPQVALNSKGEAIATWTLNLFGGTSIQAARRNSKGYWSFSQTVNGSHNVSKNPQVAIDFQGQGVIVFESQGFVDAVISKGKKNKWGSPNTISLQQSSINLLPQVASNAFGEVTAVWTVINGTIPGNEVQSSTIILAPENGIHFKGKVVTNTFPMQTECIHKLSWRRSADPEVVSYQLFAGKKLIATFANDLPIYHFEVRNACCGESTTYTLITTSVTGLKSQPKKIILF